MRALTKAVRYERRQYTRLATSGIGSEHGAPLCTKCSDGRPDTPCAVDSAQSEVHEHMRVFTIRSRFRAACSAARTTSLLAVTNRAPQTSSTIPAHLAPFTVDRRPSKRARYGCGASDVAVSRRGHALGFVASFPIPLLRQAFYCVVRWDALPRAVTVQSTPAGRPRTCRKCAPHKLRMDAVFTLRYVVAITLRLIRGIQRFGAVLLRRRFGVMFSGRPVGLHITTHCLGPSDRVAMETHTYPDVWTNRKRVTYLHSVYLCPVHGADCERETATRARASTGRASALHR